jgi:hypothetical protein
VKILLILRKFFENMAAESGSLPLKVGGFTCMPCNVLAFSLSFVNPLSFVNKFVSGLLTSNSFDL